MTILSILVNIIFMSSKIKFTSEVLESLFAELALGKGIKKALEARSLSWEGFRKLLHKKPKIRQEYEQAKKTELIIYLVKQHHNLKVLLLILK